MLQRLGHQVITSRDGEQGLRLAAEVQPDLAIIDIMMPGLSGYDVVHELRRNPRTARMPIIILTARSQPMDKHQALRAGANAFIAKPVTAQELADRRGGAEAGVFASPRGCWPGRSSDLGPSPPGIPDYGKSPPGHDAVGHAAGFEPPRASRPLTWSVDGGHGMRGRIGSTTVAVASRLQLAACGDTVLSTQHGQRPRPLHCTSRRRGLGQPASPPRAQTQPPSGTRSPHCRPACGWSPRRSCRARALSGPARGLLHRLARTPGSWWTSTSIPGAAALRLAEHPLVLTDDDHGASGARARGMGIDPRRTRSC